MRTWQPSPAIVAEVHIKRGFVRQQLAEYDAALADYRRARAIGERIGDQFIVLQSLTQRINLAFVTGDLDQGLAAGEQVLGHPDIGRYQFLTAMACNSLGNIHLRRGQYELAEGRFTRALEINRGLGEELAAARNESNLANISAIAGDNVRALAMYASALSAFEKFDDTYSTAHALTSMAQAQELTGDLAGARRSLNRALQIRVAIQDYRGQAICWLSLANLDNACGRHQQALRDIEMGRDLSLAHHMKDPYRWATISGHFADTYYCLQRWEDARRAVEEMQRIAGASGFVELVAQGHIMQGRILVRTGAGDEGLAAIRR
ncbi:MAG TPA: tetratricopeptide repeat protein, partial [Candidatus Edwardsbacteria bacterium]|nr:tetratricopeptide repeat protein [Candidatus Edwardsbacteria bacterium]